ncbi:DUF3298 and DUF4163 domain-containing protein [Bacillus ndiopicus]|uniref:DUF3298 and DUF4163 domain-containing protein n=1 Tax=Bacillus ndiopicus TaxID=1347368 RepID=UPI000A764D5D|nr:DUF3298 and DUF4163 domain-containing protein [Bacillus ndiopicus]
MSFTFPVTTQTHTVQKSPKQIIHYPQAIQMHNPSLQHFINQTIARETQQLIDKQAGNLPSTIDQMLGTYELKNNQRDVFSLTLSNYVYFYHAAHGMTYIQPLTFDLQKGKLCQLRDLFKPGSDYVKVLSEHVKAQIKERDIPVIEPFIAIKPDQFFYIADKTLVIFFQLYDLAPYYYGLPMFPISVYEIQDIVAEDGPLGRMMASN